MTGPDPAGPAERPPDDQRPVAGPAPRGTRRELALAVGLVVLGAAIALLGGGSRSSVTAPGVPTAPGTGGQAAGPAALALVAAAGAGAVLLVRNRTRVLLGVVLLAAAAGLVAVGLSPVRWAALTGAALVGPGALLVVLRARGWPQPRGRYEATPDRRTGTPRDAWDALDRGEDPTA